MINYSLFLKFVSTMCVFINKQSIYLPTGTPKKYETWKTTWVLLIRLMGPSIKTNMRKISVILTVFIQIFKRCLILLTRVHTFIKLRNRYFSCFLGLPVSIIVYCVIPVSVYIDR